MSGTETPRERQVRETFAGWEHDRAVQIEQVSAVVDDQLACGREHGHFKTAPLPDLLGKARCIACDAVVEPDLP